MGKRGGACRFEKLGAFLDAAYDLDAAPQAWLVRVTDAARAVWARPGPVHAAIYDASDVANFKIELLHLADFPDGGAECISAARHAIGPAMVARTFRRLVVACTREHGGPEMRPMHEAMAALGYPDSMGINGIDPVGTGVFISLWWADPAKLPAEETATLARMAHHLSAAHRCRVRLRQSQTSRERLDAAEGAEAILDAKRRVVHAAGAARERDAQADLIQTATARDQARARRGDAARGLDQWRPLTRARWTLVDQFETNGARYVVARENQPSVRGLAALSERERQAVAYVAMGQTTKEAAYVLGISDVTVRVLLRRAATKLGVRTRAQLLAHPEIRAAFTDLLVNA
jgi:DNA-binding CsgD family transcriptional regulator